VVSGSGRQVRTVSFDIDIPDDAIPIIPAITFVYADAQGLHASTRFDPEEARALGGLLLLRFGVPVSINAELVTKAQLAALRKVTP